MSSIAPCSDSSLPAGLFCPVCEAAVAEGKSARSNYSARLSVHFRRVHGYGSENIPITCSCTGVFPNFRLFATHLQRACLPNNGAVDITRPGNATVTITSDPSGSNTTMVLSRAGRRCRSPSPPALVLHGGEDDDMDFEADGGGGDGPDSPIAEPGDDMALGMVDVEGPAVDDAAVPPPPLPGVWWPAEPPPGHLPGEKVLLNWFPTFISDGGVQFTAAVSRITPDDAIIYDYLHYVLENKHTFRGYRSFSRTKLNQAYNELSDNPLPRSLSALINQGEELLGMWGRVSLRWVMVRD